MERSPGTTSRRPRASDRIVLSTAARLAIASATVLALGACSRDQAFDSRSDARPIPVEFERTEHPPTALDEAMKADGPGFGGWESEGLSQTASRALETLGERIRAPEGSAVDRLADLLDEEFACAALRPAGLSEVFDDGVFNVRRAPIGRADARATVHRGPRGLAEALDELGAELRSGDEIRVEFEIRGVEVASDTVTTRALYSAGALGAHGGVQQRGEWILRWRRAPGASPGLLLQSIEPSRYEEILTRLPGGSLYRDFTDSALRNAPASAAQGFHGLLHWAERISRMENVSIYGHSGIAVGDVNGDGLEDLYVCDDGGLPNRLLVQNEDGSLRDVSAEAGVDWMERSFAALFVDLDNDGDQDLVAATHPRLLICENDGRGRFTVRRRLAAVDDAYAPTAADYDNDGDLDLYITTYGGGGHGGGASEDPERESTAGEVVSSRTARGGGMESGGHSGGLAAVTVFDPLDDIEEEEIPVVPPEDGVAPVETSQRAGSATAGRAGGHSEGATAPVPYHDANNGGANALLRNDGEFRFVEVTAATGVDRNNSRFSFAAAWEDFDNDGDLDLYVANDFGRNNLFRNDGGRFVDIAARAGVEDVGAGMSVSWGDYNLDGWVDLYVGNMFSSDGMRIAYQDRFAPGHSNEDVALLRRTARGNSLFTNLGDGTFRDDSELSGINEGRWAWSSNFADLNNDGRQDVVVANGFLSSESREEMSSFFWRQVVSRTPRTDEQYDEYQAGWDAINRSVRQGKSWAGYERNCAFLNCGTDRFADVSVLSGLDFDDDGRAVALVDWDHDGDLDLWLRNRTAPRLRLMLNQLPAGAAFLALKLQGTTANRDAIGARVELVLGDGKRVVRSLRAGEGFRSQSSKWLHFGLGTTALADAVERLTVRWPGGERESFSGVEPGRRYVLQQGSGTAAEWVPPVRSSSLRPSPRASTARPPESARRIVLSRRLPPMTLSYADLDTGTERSVRPTGRPLLIQLWASSCDPCVAALRQLSERQHGLRTAGLDVLALTVDGIDLDRVTTPDDARRTLQEIGFPFDTGRATAVLLEELEFVQDLMQGHVAPLAVPAAFLFDGENRLALVYRGGVGVDRLVEDLAVLELSGEALREAALPFDGRWYSRFEPIEFYAPMLAAEWQERYPEETGRFLDVSIDYLRTRLESADLPATQKGRLEASLADTHFQRAALHAEQRRFAEAVQHYRAVLVHQPDRAEAHAGLALNLSELGDLPSAIEHFRLALSLGPAEPSTHNNLGLALFLQGETAAAIREFREALRLDPTDDDVHYDLGLALHEVGRLTDALASYRTALSLRPDALGPMTELAWILATDPDAKTRVPDEALRLARRAAELTGNRDATILDTLAAAYADAAQFDRAVITAEKALEAAILERNRTLAHHISRRLPLYREHRPYRERAGAGTGE
ncbi:MAG: tetratricopeptide repeat protein [bacterium]|nr:tetratricopeptide repeat protein [bacterium]